MSSVPKDKEPKQKSASSTAQPPAGGGDLTHDIAVRSLEKIESLGLKPIPQLYELWFRYFQGDPEIVRAIDQHPGDLDEVTCHKIYKRFLSESARDDAVKKISDQVQAAVSEMAAMLVSVKSATQEYGDTLGDVDAKIRSADSIEDLGEIVSVIVEDTRKMVEKNQALEL